MMEKKKKLIGELLLEAGIIDEHQHKAALAYQRKWGGRFGSNLVTLRFITEDRLLKFLSSYFQIPFVNFEKISISPIVINYIPFEIAHQFNIIPLAIREEGGRPQLMVATSDPTNLDAIDAIQFKTGMKAKPVLAADSAISQAIAHYYGDSPTATTPPPPDVDAIELEDEISKAGVLDYMSDSPPSPPPGPEPASAPDDEEMIIFSGGEEHHMPIDISSAASYAEKSAPSKKLPTDTVSANELAMALSELLIEKKIISFEELKEKLKTKT